MKYAKYSLNNKGGHGRRIEARSSRWQLRPSRVASRRVVAILRGAHFFGSRRAREPAAAAAAKLFRL